MPGLVINRLVQDSISRGHMYGTVANKVFYLKVDKESGIPYLEYNMDSFEVPEKRYGSVDKNVNRFMDSFNNSYKSMGVLLTGDSGTGKTMLAAVMANKALGQGMGVVRVEGISGSENIIQYIGSLSNVVILFDEFGKNFNLELQDKMLTMLSGIEHGKKLFLITENKSSAVSSLIRGRPGRVRYHIDYARMEKSVIDEYCNDMGVDNEFYASIIRKYNTTPVFSFDHLMAIVTEHLAHPNDSFDYILSLLNLKVLSKEKQLKVLSIKNKDTGDKVEWNSIDSATMSDFKDGYSVYIYLKEKPTVYLNNKEIVSIKDNVVTCETDSYIIELEN